MQAEELGTSTREAATRVFSNSSGSYSSNVNLAVENSSWSDESQLQEMYLKRKSFAFNSDRYTSRAMLQPLRAAQGADVMQEQPFSLTEGRGYSAKHWSSIKIIQIAADMSN